MEIINKYRNYILKGLRLYMPFNEYKKIRNYFYDKNELDNEIYLILHQNSLLRHGDYINKYAVKLIQKRMWAIYRPNSKVEALEANQDFIFEYYHQDNTKVEFINNIIEFVNFNSINDTITEFNLKNSAYIKKLLSNVSMHKKNSKTVRRDKKYVKVDNFSQEDLIGLEKSIKSRALKRGYYYRLVTENDLLFNKKVKEFREKKNITQRYFIPMLIQIGIKLSREKLSEIENDRAFFSTSEMKLIALKLLSSSVDSV